MSNLTFDSYQAAAGTTRTNPDLNIDYFALGLCGEAGEVAEKIKKAIRDGRSVMVDADWARSLALELGDVLWYLSQLATEIGYPLSYIAKWNIDKIEDRKARGVQHGSGDNR